MPQNELMIGTKIKSICDNRGISVRQLERNAGIPERTISRWDTNMPSVDKVAAVAKSLEVPIEELLGIHVPKPVEEDKKIPDTDRAGMVVEDSVELNAKREQLIHDIFRLNDNQAAALLSVVKALLSNQ